MLRPLFTSYIQKGPSWGAPTTLRAADTDFALQARMLAAMAFVPALDVDDAFAELARNVPEELLPIPDYFEDTYLGAVRRGIRRAPRFPATMWSIYHRVTDELPRTNSAIEGWHSALGANAGGHHINLWRFIGILQREEALASVRMTHLLQGRDHPPQRPTLCCSQPQSPQPRAELPRPAHTGVPTRYRVQLHVVITLADVWTTVASICHDLMSSEAFVCLQ